MRDVIDQVASLDPGAAVALARRAIQHAAQTNPAVADIDRLLGDIVDGGRSPEADAFLRLLAGDKGVDSELLGIPITGARVVVALPDDPRRLSGVRAALAEEHELLVVHAGSVYALVRNVPRRAGDDRALRSAMRLAALVGRIQPGTHLGVSAAVSEAGQLVAAARDAADAAQVAAQRDVPWLSVDDVWAELVVERLRAALMASLTTDHPLARLAEHDRRHRSDLAITVGIWLALRRDAAEAARALMLHPNTLRYRLRRAQDVSGLDLTDSLQSLVAQLHFCRTD